MRPSRKASTAISLAALSTVGKAPQTFQIGGSYECRGQNHDPAAKLSEHAYANGVDVMGSRRRGSSDAHSVCQSL